MQDTTTKGDTTPTPTHTCHGAIFVGTPRPIAIRECPACI